MAPNTEQLVEKILEDCKRYAEKHNVPTMATDIQYALARIRRDRENAK